MQILALIEPLAANRFRARSGNPFDITVEAESRQEAIQELQQRIRERFANGAEIVMIEISEE